MHKDMKNTACPKCGSKEIEIISNSDLSFIKCKSCGYDESLYDITPKQRTSQREKSKYSPYKSGGGRRAQK